MENNYLPLVSVIIPCYNYAAYIGETIESILAQTYSHWEIIIVDDGSKDNTAKIVKKFTQADKRILYHYQVNGGLSAARNTGLRLAGGKYIQLLDADDFIAPTKIAIQVSALESDNSTALVYGDTYNFKDTPTISERIFRQFFLSKEPVSGQGNALALHMANDNIFLVSCPLFRRVMADAVGGFDTALFSLEDWYFWYRAALLDFKFKYDNQPGTEFYVRSHTSNMSSNRHKMWQYKIRARQTAIQFMQDKLQSGVATDLDLKAILKKHTALLYEEQARFNLLFGSLGKGLVNTVQYFLHGNKPLRIWYDSAYWLKERLLGRNKISS